VRPHYGAVTVNEPSIFLCIETDERSVDEVRAVAAELLAAAHILDQITR